MNEGQLIIEINRLTELCNKTTDEMVKKRIIDDISFYKRQLENY